MNWRILLGYYLCEFTGIVIGALAMWSLLKAMGHLK